MLTSLAFILLSGLLFGYVMERLHLPRLLGMILAGMLLSPHAFHLLDESMMSIAADLRQLALVIILLRAGLTLNINDLKQVGRPAILMCFLPATFEMLGVILLAPNMLGVTVIEAAVMGSVIAAVSPAVVVPRMIKLIEEGYGVSRSIPQMILAGASADDVYVIVMFTAFTSLAKGDAVSVGNFLQIPTSIVLGIFVGIVCGLFLSVWFQKIFIRDGVKVIILFGISFLLLALQNHLTGAIQMSGLIGIMTMGLTLHQKKEEMASLLSKKYNELWIGAEIILFVLVGATVDVTYAVNAGVLTIILILLAMLFRMFGVFISVLGTKLTAKEKIFCMLAYTPKATVQAAIGAVPLSMGLACGQIVLTVAVLSILITAPFGAICIDYFYQKLLCRDGMQCSESSEND